MVDNPIHRFHAFLMPCGGGPNPKKRLCSARTNPTSSAPSTERKKLPKPKLTEMFNDVCGVEEGEEVPGIIVCRGSGSLPFEMAYVIWADGAARRAWEIVEEIRKCLGAMGDREEEVRGGRGGCHGLRWAGIVSRSGI